MSSPQSDGTGLERFNGRPVLSGVWISVVLPRTSGALTGDVNQSFWKRVLDAITMRTGPRSYAQSESLRYWREVIGRAIVRSVDQLHSSRRPCRWMVRHGIQISQISHYPQNGICVVKYLSHSFPDTRDVEFKRGILPLGSSR